MLDVLLETLEIESMLACPLAMREGMLESRVAALEESEEGGGSLRQSSVLALAQRTDCDLKHAMHVAVHGQAFFTLPPPCRPHAAVQVRGNLLPGVEPVFG